MPSNTTKRLDTVSWSASPHQKNPSTPHVMEDIDALFIVTELFTPAPVSSVASVYYNMAGSSLIIISGCRTRTTHNPVPCVLNPTGGNIPMEQITGFEPAHPAWRAGMLPITSYLLIKLPTHGF